MRVFIREQDTAKYGDIDEVSVARMLSEGWTEIADSYVPTSEQIAQEAQRIVDLAAVDTAKADTTVQYLVAHTPQECCDMVLADVTNFDELKEITARLAMAISVIARKQLR